MSRLMDYLNGALGCIYVWGAQGEGDITTSWIRTRETSESNAERAIKLWRKRQAEGMCNIRAYDCSGLIIRYMLDNALIDYDTTADGLLRLSKRIEKRELKKGDLVFRHNGLKAYHVGVYTGHGNVIHAKGRDDGVLLEAIDQNGTFFWNRFGRIKGLMDEIMEDENMKKLEITDPLMHGDEVKALQEALNGLGYDCGTADGICGKKTMAAAQLFAAAHSVCAMPETLNATVTMSGTEYTGVLTMEGE